MVGECGDRAQGPHGCLWGAIALANLRQGWGAEAGALSRLERRAGQPATSSWTVVREMGTVVAPGHLGAG